MSFTPLGTRRVTITLRKWPYGLYFGVRPTIVINGLGQPTQWGEGTWALAEADAPIAVYMHQWGMTFGRADYVLPAGAPSQLEYRAPAIAYFPGSLGQAGTTQHGGRRILLGLIVVPLSIAAVVVAAAVGIAMVAGG